MKKYILIDNFKGNSTTRILNALAQENKIL